VTDVLLFRNRSRMASCGSTHDSLAVVARNKEGTLLHWADARLAAAFSQTVLPGTVVLIVERLVGVTVE